ncbi:MAG: DNA alkylation repair protein [Myxococcota bacterium]
MDIEQTVEQWTAQLTAAGTQARAEGEKRYLKSDLTFLGVTVPGVRALGKAFARAHADLERTDLLGLVSATWGTEIHELRSLSIAVMAHFPALMRATDMARLETMLGAAGTWAHVDWLATTTVADLVERFVSARRRLDRWATDDNFWIRRSAMLALLPPLRRGAGDFDGFAAIALPMLGDKEFFIRKAIGWVLREVSKKRPELVIAFLDAHAAEMSGLSVREATKRLSAAERKRLLAVQPARPKLGSDR